MTRDEAKQLIEANKSNTAWYGENNIDIFGDEICTFKRMFELFRFRCGLGEAETACVIGALKLSGAKIKGEL